jgi:protein TonB
MNLAERHIDRPLMIDELVFALEQTLSGHYADALVAVARAKGADPRNIYVIAMEKQIARLQKGGMSPEERTEALETLPGLVERAHAERKGRLPLPSASVPGKPVQRPLIDERESRLRELIDQYFRHADDWVKRGDYASALQEIHRVLLVDPENRIAREYERKINELTHSDAKSAAVRDTRVRDEPAPRAIPAADQDSPFTPKIPLIETAQIAEPEAAQPHRNRGKRTRGLVISIAAVAVIAAIVILVAPSNRSSSGPAPAVAATVQSEQPQTAAPVETKQEPTSPVNEPESIETPVPDVVPVERKIAKAPEIVPRAITLPETPAREKAVVNPAVPTAQPVRQMETRTRTDIAANSAVFIPVEKAPRILRLEQPSFSESDLAVGLSGEIRVKVQINKEGRPVQALVISSTNKALNEPVVDAVMKSTYEPGVMSNGPVMAWIVIPFKFK